MISVLIPAFNAENYIKETILSCCVQGPTTITEVIVVDDHSTDRTNELVATLISECAAVNIRLVMNPLKGACAARNYGLSLAQGTAVKWLDADDILGPGHLLQQLDLLEKNPNHLIASKWRRFAGSPENLWPEEQGNWSAVPECSSPREWLLSERMMIPAGWLGTRDLFQSIAPWDETLLINQDGEYFTRAIVASAGVIFEPNSRVYYRSSIAGSVSHFKPEKAPSLYRAAESFERTVLELGDDQDLKTLISNHYQGFIYRVYPLVPDLRKKAQAKVKDYGKPTRHNDVAESRFAKLFCWLFGWKLLVQLRLLRSKFQV
jgi:glycosyltransferase involved in cell wall biosynthesis